jgi:GntR family transcriptional regulator/MocR family aminotransferase
VPSAAGLHVSALLRSGSVEQAAAVVDRARARGVLVAPLAPTALGAPRAGLILGYGLVPTDRLPAALTHLAAALAGAEGAGRPRPARDGAVTGPELARSSTPVVVSSGRPPRFLTSGCMRTRTKAAALLTALAATGTLGALPANAATTGSQLPS